MTEERSGVIHADLGLALWLEGVEASGNAFAAEEMAERRPEIGATSIPVGSGDAIFIGVNSHLTQAFAVGLQGPVSNEEFDELEDFFFSRGSDVFVEACSLADISLTRHFCEREYEVLEYSNVLVRHPADTTGDDAALPAGLHVSLVGPEDAELWTRIVGEGFFGDATPPDLAQMFQGMTCMKHGSALLVRQHGEAIAAGAMTHLDSVINCVGDGTPERFRGRGGQSALIRYRIQAARKLDCEYVMATTACGSASQRNYERAGFRVAYTRAKWHRKLP